MATSELTGHVKTYCSLSTLSQEAESALASILASLQGGEGAGNLSVQQLIDSGEEVLTSTDDSVRNRGTMLLSEVLTRRPVLLAGQPAGAVATLLTFFARRLEDEPCVREVLRGARFIVEAVQSGVGREVDMALVALVTGIFEHVHLQSLSLSDRNNAYQIVHSVIVRFDLAPSIMGESVLMGFVGIMDGERDPRNLKLCFSIIPTLARRHLSSTSEAEALFAVFSCYFPITFTPPPNDTVGITSEMLREGLLECMSCHRLMATPSLDLVQGKLASAAEAQARIDSLDVIAALASRFGVARSMGTRGVRQIWSLLRLQVDYSR
jgi:DNA repair/transcription protein MET18/MMS19